MISVKCQKEDKTKQNKPLLRLTLTRALLELASLLLPTVLATVVWLLTEAAVGVSRSLPLNLDLVLGLSGGREKEGDVSLATVLILSLFGYVCSRCLCRFMCI